MLKRNLVLATGVAAGLGAAVALVPQEVQAWVSATEYTHNGTKPLVDTGVTPAGAGLAGTLYLYYWDGYMDVTTAAVGNAYNRALRLQCSDGTLRDDFDYGVAGTGYSYAACDWWLSTTAAIGIIDDL